MSALLEKNLKVLATRYSDIVSQIREIEASETRRYTVVKRGGREANLFDKITNEFVYDPDRPKGSALDDVRQSKTYLNRLVYMFGLGLGYHMDAFLKSKHTDSATFFIVYEADVEILFHAFSERDFTGLLTHPRLEMIVGKVDENHISRTIMNLFSEKSDLKYYIKAQSFLETPYLFNAYKDRYSKFFSGMRIAYSNMLNHYGNDPEDSLIGIVNTIKNIDIIVKNPGIDSLEGKFAGRVGVVVSTGPSLKKNIHLLKSIQDEVVIVSVDASVRILQEYGIKPHAVTSLERVMETARLFDDIDPTFVEDTVFTACPVVRPETYANFSAKPVIVYREFATFKWLGIERGPLMEIGPSSSNMAFCILEYMGCDKIILIGQDFAYAPDGKTHAEGTTYGSQQDKQFAHAYLDLEVEGNYVPTLRTTQVWDMFRRYMEKDALRFEGRVINATEGGAKIEGTELLALSDAIERYVAHEGYANDVTSIIKNSATPISQRDMDNDLAMVKKRLKEGVSYCQHVMDKYREVISINDEIEAGKLNLAGGNSIDTIKLTKAFNDVQSSMVGMFAEDKYYLIIMHYVQPYLVNIVMDLFNIQNSVENAQERMLRYIKLSAVASVTMIQLIEKLEDLFVASLESLADTHMEAAEA